MEDELIILDSSEQSSMSMAAPETDTDEGIILFPSLKNEALHFFSLVKASFRSFFRLWQIFFQIVKILGSVEMIH